jgi:hypothetical protein
VLVVIAIAGGSIRGSDAGPRNAICCDDIGDAGSCCDEYAGSCCDAYAGICCEPYAGSCCEAYAGSCDEDIGPIAGGGTECGIGAGRLDGYCGLSAVCECTFQSFGLGIAAAGGTEAITAEGAMLVGGESMRSGRCDERAGGGTDADGRITVSSSMSWRGREDGREGGGAASDGGGATLAPRERGGGVVLLREIGAPARGGGAMLGAFVGMNIVISSSETDFANARGRSDGVNLFSAE